MSFSSLIYGVASWIANMDFMNNSLNILGMIWLVALIFLACQRFNIEIENLGGIWPKLQRQRKLVRAAILFVLAFGTIYFFQILIDDLITTPIDLGFGSWILLQPWLGPFTIWKLFMFKVNVYLNMLLYFFFFSVCGLWPLLKFNRKSAFWLCLLIAFQLVLSIQHNYNFRSLMGAAKTFSFWESYPEFRIILAYLWPAYSGKAVL